MNRPRILLLANYYHGGHAENIKTYHRLNKTASSWNSALIAELKKLDVELHIAQFYPVLRKHVFKEDNVTYYYLPRVPKIDGYTSLLKRWRVRRLAKRINPDLIHGIGSEHGYAYAAIQTGWPSVITIHGYLKMINRLPGHKSFLKRVFLEREERKALASASTVIAINGYMRDLFIQDGCRADKITIVPNALNPVFLSPCPGGKTGRDIDILMVGTLHPLKNHHIALEVFSLIKSRHKTDLHITIAGSPTVLSQEYYTALLERQKADHLDNIRFVGSVNQSELKLLYCRSKVLLHISAFEADPTVVAEALACGALPVVNPVAGLAHRVKNNINGYHVNIQDVRQVARVLISILEGGDAIRELVKHGRQSVISERFPQHVAQETHKVYISTINANQP